ncbi:MAG: class D sortase [Lachnospiraceae bacterium]|nr:class D sortase [Lachnospiraceae bacterium]
MAIGLALILITMGMNLYASYANRQEVASFREAIAESPFATESDIVQQETREQPGASAEETAIAILRIPSIECEEIVKDGSARWTLAKALGHMEGTAYPGEPGNCAIAGHRNYNFGLFFNRLDEVQVEDEIILDTKEASYTYRVTEIKVVEPEDLSVLDQTEDATITLITCTPLYIATHRLIVSGELVETTYR